MSIFKWATTLTGRTKLFSNARDDLDHRHNTGGWRAECRNFDFREFDILRIHYSIIYAGRISMEAKLCSPYVGAHGKRASWDSPPMLRGATTCRESLQLSCQVPVAACLPMFRLLRLHPNFIYELCADTMNLMRSRCVTLPFKNWMYNIIIDSNVIETGYLICGVEILKSDINKGERSCTTRL